MEAVRLTAMRTRARAIVSNVRVEDRIGLGVDYGTNSVRALLVNLHTGKELASHVFDYPTGTKGVILDHMNDDLARQNPADYMEGFKVAVKGAIAAAGMP